MHELAIAQSIVDAVAERTQGTGVAVVHLRVGRLSGVVPDALRFCFHLASDGTSLQGAVLDIQEPEGRGRCRDCEADFVLADLILLCPCGSADVEIYSGQELSVQSVEVAARV